MSAISKVIYFLLKVIFLLSILSLETQALSQECNAEMNTHVWKFADTTWLEVNIALQNQSDKPVFYYYYFNSNRSKEQVRGDSLFLDHILEVRDLKEYSHIKMRETKEIFVRLPFATYVLYSETITAPIKIITIKPGKTLLITLNKAFHNVDKFRRKRINLKIVGHYFLKKTDEVYFSFRRKHNRYYGDVYLFPYHREINLSTKVRIK